MRAAGGLTFKTLSSDGNMSFTVRDSGDGVAFRVIPSNGNPIYGRFDGSVKQVFQGSPDSGGSGYRVLRVVN